MESRGRRVETIILRIKSHLQTIQEYYDNDGVYVTSPITINAIRRAQENIVSLTRQLINYEDLFQNVYCVNEDVNEDKTSTSSRESFML